ARAAHSTPAASPRHKPPFEQHKLAGGAVAIGGAALLAWIVASHPPHDAATESRSTNPRLNASADQDVSPRPVEVRAQHEHVTTGAVKPAAARPPPPATSLQRAADATPVEAAAARIAEAEKPAPVVAAAAPAQVHRAAVVSEHQPAQASVAARTRPDFSVHAQSKPASPARLVQRETRGNERAVTQTAGRGVAQRNVKSRHNVHEFAPYHEAGPVTTHRTHGAYSEAQSYSPRQTGAKQADEFASILAYAKTYAPAQASNRPAVPADSTDWVNHVSQRRITEVPDRFTK
ncbi:MAG TPA: hypothetical protein VIH96_16550, partial [Paraburkholderia sp.]